MLPTPDKVRGLAFFDFDGTIVPSDVVDQYLWFVRKRRSVGRLCKLLLDACALKRADRQSRRLFNELFYAHYRGFRRDWLIEQGRVLSEAYLRPKVYPKLPDLLSRLRGEGFLPVLVTGSLDVAISPLAASLGFARIIANALEYEAGTATGRIRPPVIAENQKVQEMLRLCQEYSVDPVICRAFSDDTSDLPMLEAVGHPAAANPKPELRRLALDRGWPIEELR